MRNYGKPRHRPVVQKYSCGDLLRGWKKKRITAAPFVRGWVSTEVRTCGNWSSLWERLELKVVKSRGGNRGVQSPARGPNPAWSQQDQPDCDLDGIEPASLRRIYKFFTLLFLNTSYLILPPVCVCLKPVENAPMQGVSEMHSLHKQIVCHSRRTIIRPFINIYAWAPSSEFVALSVSSQVMKYTWRNIERRNNALQSVTAVQRSQQQGETESQRQGDTDMQIFIFHLINSQSEYGQEEGFTQLCAFYEFSLSSFSAQSRGAVTCSQSTCKRWQAFYLQESTCKYAIRWNLCRSQGPRAQKRFSSECWYHQLELLKLLAWKLICFFLSGHLIWVGCAYN